ncbi:MAG: type II toxin-antitoxin system MqsA family antitoxin [Deltaproteobacteria bacterium]|nr:type II toxin-antitoxin system MqsA family antitoxin [Deltaproteobacteria bacterium]
MMLHITVCPTCGKKNLKKICRDWIATFRGRKYTVPSLEFYECPDCGEKIYDRKAMQKIEAHSPAFVKQRAREKVPA